MQTVQIDSPPKLGTYGRVLRRLDRDPRFATQQKFVSYDTHLRGRAIKHPDGKVALTMFFPVGKETAAERGCKIGWIDVTDEWHDGRPLTEEEIHGLEWLDLRKKAVKLGLSAKGGRPEVEARMIAKMAADQE